MCSFYYETRSFTYGQEKHEVIDGGRGSVQKKSKVIATKNAAEAKRKLFQPAYACTNSISLLKDLFENPAKNGNSWWWAF